jgi:hypothetical protein
LTVQQPGAHFFIFSLYLWSDFLLAFYIYLVNLGGYSPNLAWVGTGEFTMELQILQNLTPAGLLDESASYLAQEYETWRELFATQPALAQHFMEAQGKRLAEALVEEQSYVRFALPDKVTLPDKQAGNSAASEQVISVPGELCEQHTGHWMISPFRRIPDLRQQLDKLESHPNAAVAASAGLLRFTTAMYMVHSMLPAGRKVVYRLAEDDEIPTLPVEGNSATTSALTSASDAIVESGARDGRRGELMVPFVEAARRFYLPQWVAFDDQDRLLVSSFKEAEAILASMQRFLRILHGAVALAPYMVACPEYQEKRYGMLGQLVNQGRALARYETQDIIQNIQQRASENTLNRGLEIKLPYFDDQILQMKTLEMVIVPSGRIMFIPSFVVLATHKEQVKVAQDTRLSPSTRKHLLHVLRMVEHTFESHVSAEERSIFLTSPVVN